VAGQTIGFGVLLIILGVWSWADAGAEIKNITALIPAFLGLPLVLLGALAVWKDHLRKHAMHAAAVLGLLGVIAAVVNLIRVKFKGPSVNTTVLMGLVSGVFLGLCINSFIQARKAQMRQDGKD